MRTSKLIFNILIVSFVFILMTGCSNNGTSSNTSSAASIPNASSETASSGVPSAVPSEVSSSAQAIESSAVLEDNSKLLLTQIMESAKTGKLIDCDFPVKTATIEDVTAKWGDADKTEYVAAAKGTYAEFSKRKLTFGFNKGSQIFEARTFNSKLGAITLSKVKEIYGNPAYTNTSDKENIIGYTAGKEFKILLVFSTAAGKTDPVLDHYSVFYPEGTVNMMADDPGRQW